MSDKYLEAAGHQMYVRQLAGNEDCWMEETQRIRDWFIAEAKPVIEAWVGDRDLYERERPIPGKVYMYGNDMVRVSVTEGEPT